MSSAIDTFDLNGLRLESGEGRHLELDVRIEPFELGTDTYAVSAGAAVGAVPEAAAGAAPGVIPVRLDISRTTGHGYALRLRFDAALEGPCMRCLEPARAGFEVDAREVSQPGAGEELDSPYIEKGQLDIGAWARDALALTLPRAILCRADCAGLCPVCGQNLNLAGPEHHHEAEPDPRWAKLSELKFDA